MSIVGTGLAITTMPGCGTVAANEENLIIFILLGIAVALALLCASHAVQTLLQR